METHARYALVGGFVLVLLVGAFGFVYWLGNSTGLTKNTTYTIRFVTSVSGLTVGAPVLFNGIQVGTVATIQLDPALPRQVNVTIAVNSTIPLRADTQVGLEFQGLAGIPVVSLRGGTPDAPIRRVANGDGGLLDADPLAGQSLTDSARTALQQLQSVLTDNSPNIKSAIANINTFSDALARNSDRVDSILVGLQHLTGGEAPKPEGETFDLMTPTKFEALPKKIAAQIVVPEPTAMTALNTQKILISTDAGTPLSAEIARWADTIPTLVQAKIVQSFENANYLDAVALPNQDFVPDFQLLIDIRTFEIEKTDEESSKLAAHLAFSCKILGKNGRFVASKLFDVQIPTTDTSPRNASNALSEAFGQAATQIVQWTARAI